MLHRHLSTARTPLVLAAEERVMETLFKKQGASVTLNGQSFPIVEGVIPNQPGLEFFHCIDRIIAGTATLRDLNNLIADMKNISFTFNEPKITINGLSLPASRIIHCKPDDYYEGDANEITPFIYAMLRGRADIATCLARLQPNLNQSFTISNMRSTRTNSSSSRRDDHVGRMADIICGCDNYQPKAYLSALNAVELQPVLFMAYLYTNIRENHALDIIQFIIPAHEIRKLERMATRFDASCQIEKHHIEYSHLLNGPCSVAELETALSSNPLLAQQYHVLKTLPGYLALEIDAVKRRLGVYAKLSDASQTMIIDHLSRYELLFAKYSQIAGEQLTEPKNMISYRQ